jgi:hypothetical protein
MVAQNQEFDNDPRIDGQVAACRKFFHDIQPAVIAVEHRYGSMQYQFAGTPDLLAVVAKHGKLIVDWKASFSGLEPLQLAGYGILSGLNKGVAVQLKEDGTYKMGEVVDLRRWKARFLATLTVYGTKQELGIKED